MTDSDLSRETQSSTLTTPHLPVAQNERYALMDVVRGFALFGVLAANMRDFNLPSSVYTTPELFFHSRLDVWTQVLLDIFISAKFYALFAFLFGLGFAIQMTRAQSRSTRFPWFYLRRLAALAMFGLLHGILIWNGDILLPYAIGGFWLFWFRNAKRKTVAWWIGCLWGAGALLQLVVWTLPRFHVHGHIGIAGNQQAATMTPQLLGIVHTYQHSHLLGVIRETAYLWTGGHPPSHQHPWAWLGGTLPEAGALSILSLGIFLLGLWIWRRGVLQALPEFQPALRRICAIALPLGLALQIWTTLDQHFHKGGHPAIPPVSALLLSYAGYFGVPLLSCGYASGLALLFLSERWRKRILWLAPLGRMALTNYLMQSVICVAFFSGIVTGLYGRVGMAWDMVATVVLYTAQVFFSRWWLSRFQFGPVEWLWRTLTYLRRPQLRAAR